MAAISEKHIEKIAFDARVSMDAVRALSDTLGAKLAEKSVTQTDVGILLEGTLGGPFKGGEAAARYRRQAAVQLLWLLGVDRRDIPTTLDATPASVQTALKNIALPKRDVVVRLPKKLPAMSKMEKEDTLIAKLRAGLADPDRFETKQALAAWVLETIDTAQQKRPELPQRKPYKGQKSKAAERVIRLGLENTNLSGAGFIEVVRAKGITVQGISDTYIRRLFNSIDRVGVDGIVLRYQGLIQSNPLKSTSTLKAAFEQVVERKKTSPHILKAFFEVSALPSFTPLLAEINCAAYRRPSTTEKRQIHALQTAWTNARGPQRPDKPAYIHDLVDAHQHVNRFINAVRRAH